MPRYSGVIFSFLLVTACLGFNIVQYPLVWEMVSDTEFPLTYMVAQNESSGSPPPTGDSSAPFDFQQEVETASSSNSSNNAVVTQVAESSPPPSTRNPSQGYGPIPPNPAIARTETLANQEKPRSTRSLARSLRAAPTVEESLSSQESPSAEQLVQQDSAKIPPPSSQNPGDSGLENDFEVSQPQSAYANQYREEEKTEEVSTSGTLSDSSSKSGTSRRQRRETSQPVEENRAIPANDRSSLQEYSPLMNSEPLDPFEKVNAFRNSPIDFDAPYQYTGADSELDDPWKSVNSSL
ncbi:MAG: hypothetical protein ACRC10_01650 [Thermoguttaceae bacterium]